MKIEIEIPEQKEPTSGWTLDYKWLEDFEKYLEENHCEHGSIGMEEIEAVLIDLKNWSPQ